MAGRRARSTPAAVAETLFDFRLRSSQTRVIEAVAEGRDTLAVLPTGSGKSAIYQVAGLALGGLTLVISPLVALQRDQLRMLRELPGRAAVEAALLNSAQPLKARQDTLARVRAGELDFLLLGPEQLTNPETHEAVLGGTRPVDLFVVDEAHLVSEWGQDFRPEYLRLVDAIKRLHPMAVLALTATASPPVQADITRRLGMRAPEVIVADFDRPNISLAVRRTQPRQPEGEALDDACVDTVIWHDTPALVYALTRARAESIAGRLRHDVYKVAPYHAGMGAAARANVQEGFMSGRLDVIVATSAFGMGIDKPDIRTVIHAGVPGSLDDYYQEIGRGGRDGRPAAAVLVHDPRTIRIPRLLAARDHLGDDAVHNVVDELENATGGISASALAEAAGVPAHTVERVVNELAELGAVAVRGSGRDRVIARARCLPPSADLAGRLEARDHQRRTIVASRLDAAREYAETTRCRRSELLAYFGETYEPPCGNCDNDDEPARSTPARPRMTSGEPVRHRLWGDGMLLSGDDHVLLVYFETVGYRHLTASSFASGVLSRR